MPTLDNATEMRMVGIWDEKGRKGTRQRGGNIGGSSVNMNAGFDYLKPKARHYPVIPLTSARGSGNACKSSTDRNALSTSAWTCPGT
ncbi:hypothetical protein P7K49_008782 [Saguinus oedipus]|uniref:Uncharacterized protein n=1 Tax=Saguinus oedipus TaxID=9490 RepID=A0ABQ9VZG5_SAGOE|nr:hypothetical protein P7K49_008782 [Saguinus oedipus]